MRVIVVGAGPAGAALALLLSRRGIDVTLLERHTDFAREFRGEALMPSGIGALEQMGLESRVRALPQVGLRVLEVFRGDRRLARVPFGADEVGVVGPRIISQPAMLEMLVEEASRSVVAFGFYAAGHPMQAAIPASVAFGAVVMLGFVQSSADEAG